jgi:hypothetical protein
MAMDVKRDPAILKRKRIRQSIIWTIVAAAVIVTSVAVSHLKPAAPSVQASTLCTARSSAADGAGGSRRPPSSPR